MSPAQNTVKSLAEQRARKQKIFIAVGSVVLLAVLGYQLPKIMGHKGGQSAAPAASTVAPGAAGAPVLPSGQLPGTDRVIVQRDSNQLISFGLFKSKDPFVQQLTTTATPTPVPAPTTPAPTGAPTATPTPSPVVPVGTPSSTPPSAPSSPAAPGTTTPAGTPTAPAVPTEALIATNDVCERVAVKGTFPTTENIFRLASIAKDGKSVEIGIVGGSFDSGKPTATLKLGSKLTLVNTADGTRYVIELKAQCANVANETGTTQTTTSPQPTSTAPVSPAPTPTPTTTTTDTVTTPIVTDSLDTTPPPSG